MHNSVVGLTCNFEHIHIRPNQLKQCGWIGYGSEPGASPKRLSPEALSSVKSMSESSVNSAAFSRNINNASV